jgi:hypothetical protein
MATKKAGILTPSPEWWVHLRRAKKHFWRRERKAAQSMAIAEARLEALREEALAAEAGIEIVGFKDYRPIEQQAASWGAMRDMLASWRV